MQHIEVNFDGLVGPTHNYAGLSSGNIASTAHANSVSSPKQAALQGLHKMNSVRELGLTQGVLPPHFRPDLQMLKQLGFTGTPEKILQSAARHAPQLLTACYSASAMWTANAATVSPGNDTLDGRLHLTPANLNSKFHRSLEHATTAKILKATFADPEFFRHHSALPAHGDFGDEGAANHTRLAASHRHSGIELFTYGMSVYETQRPRPNHFVARQTLEASQAIARLHGLDDGSCVYIQQNPAVIDQGVFHNDVIAVGNENVLFYHQQAFLDTERKLVEIREKLDNIDMYFIEVPDSMVSVEDAVTSYLFNSQLVTLPDQSMALIAPQNCADNPAVKAYLDHLLTLNTPLQKIHYFDLSGSMNNGGGPACLRLRVQLDEAELAAVNQASLLNDSQYHRLTRWVEKHYREQIQFNDLLDPALLIESQTALDELTQIMKLGSIYPFQR